jgi:hypothetical protein
MSKSKELQAALKLINDACKKPNFYEQLENQSLSNRIASIKSTFLCYVDAETINYYKTEMVKKDGELRHNMQYRPVDLSKIEREKAIEEMKWFLRDITECINHIEDDGVIKIKIEHFHSL